MPEREKHGEELIVSLLLITLLLYNYLNNVSKYIFMYLWVLY